MGQYIVKMPDIGEGIAEVELVQWNVKPGDEVKEDQILADVMTDKATVEIPSPVSGTVLALGGEVGKLMAVGSELIRLEVAGAGNVKGETSPRPGAAAAPAPAPTPTPAKPAPREAEPRSEPEREATSPAVAAATRRAPAPTAPTRPAGEKPIASPAVRNRAWELGIELQFVHGSGPAGRITQQDLEVYLAARGQPMSTRGSGGPAYAERHDEQQLPLVGLRKRIAQKMQEAKRRIPHFSYVEEIDVTELEALRVQLNQRHAAERGKLTLLPLIARAVVLALRDFPRLNARFDDDAGVVTQHGAVHLGIAAQTDAGLMVPVVRHAEARDVWGIATEINRLAEAARSNSATRDELSGSTITISSLGPLGGIVSTPVINHPEVAIVGVNRIVEKPVVRNGAVIVRQTMNLSSSFDHRVIDGMDAARFIQAVRGLLEAPALLFVD
ncbi:dihydrolipoamide acetyltransferase family protein [Aquabacterium humicola]|uniref:dihydrolipoamide acetyltransferase family protein n=1 Tax=Aquabacterium humicola TaxID=3237377 RepID=UPI002543C357|nr:dihydrolipoamide acetyltransferase family protein [Rubrivivax pictus]